MIKNEKQDAIKSELRPRILRTAFEHGLEPVLDFLAGLIAEFDDELYISRQLFSAVAAGDRNSDPVSAGELESSRGFDIGGLRAY